MVRMVGRPVYGLGISGLVGDVHDTKAWVSAMAPWGEVMAKWKKGKLKSGGSGKAVKNRKQAIAIMLSEKKKAEQGKSEYMPVNPLRRKGGR